MWVYKAYIILYFFQVWFSPLRVWNRIKQIVISVFGGLANAAKGNGLSGDILPKSRLSPRAVRYILQKSWADLHTTDKGNVSGFLFVGLLFFPLPETGCSERDAARLGNDGGKYLMHKLWKKTELHLDHHTDFHLVIGIRKEERILFLFGNSWQAKIMGRLKPTSVTHNVS